MSHLRVRCPSCSRLYQIEAGGLFTTEPHFQCLSCPTLFTFDFPPPDVENIPTRAVTPRSSASAEPVRACIRCGSMSPRSSAECLNCGVLFEKVEGLPMEPGMKIRPSLVRLWKEILEDYENEERHMVFINSCCEQEAIEFARMKYEEIGRLQGGDATSKAMLARLEAVETVAPKVGPKAEVSKSVERRLSGAGSVRRGVMVPHVAPKAKEEPRWFPWVRMLIFSPFLVSVTLVLWGFQQDGNRNMVGTGIAIGLLTYGLIAGFLGGFSLKNIRPG